VLHECLQTSQIKAADVNGIPVGTVIDMSLGDIAQATIAYGAPIITVQSTSRCSRYARGRVAWFYLHEYAHHALGQVLGMLSGQVPYTMAIDVQADCTATQVLRQRTAPDGTQAKTLAQQFLVALNNAGDPQHPPSAQRAQLIANC
jgi:hypothetical protein